MRIIMNLGSQLAIVVFFIVLLPIILITKIFL
jgi:hypothetical protein